MKQKVLTALCALLFLPSYLFSQLYINNQIFSQNKIFYLTTSEEPSNQVILQAASTLQNYLSKIFSSSYIIEEIKPHSTMENILPSTLFPIASEGIYLKVDPTLSSYLAFNIEPKSITIVTKEAASLLNAVYYFLEKYFNLLLFSTEDEIPTTQKRFDFSVSRYSFTPTFTTRNINSKLFNESNNKKLLRLSSPFEKNNELQFFTLLEKNLWPKLCLNKNEQLDSHITALNEVTKSNPDFKNCHFAICVNDFEFCECPSCKKIKKSQRHKLIYNYANMVAKALPEFNFILDLDENYTLPKETKFEPNIFIRYEFNYSFNKPLHDSLYKKNNEIKRSLLQWKNMASRVIIRYPLFYKNSPLVYAPIFSNCGITIKELASYGFTNMEVQLPTSELTPFDDLKAYLTSQLMWDATSNPQKIIKRFLSHYYGDASTKLLSFINFADNNAYYLDSMLDTKSDLKFHSTGYLSWVMVKSYRNYFRAALILANKKEPHSRNIKFLYGCVVEPGKILNYNIDENL